LLVDTSSFFNYPTLESQAQGATPAPAGFLADRGQEDWSIFLGSVETRRFRPDEPLFIAGEPDRAFYLLTDGRVRADAQEGFAPDPIRPPAVLGGVAFLDGLPRAITMRALDHGEALRMSFDAWEALAAREPVLGRAVLLDVARAVATQARSGATGIQSWSG
jgi:CRP/FNR family transcriptional regulator, cyclic AMP receptor protein